MGMSQEDLAEALGMHRTQLGHIEQGRKDCRLSTILRVAAVLRMPASRLLRAAAL
jgi:DNA-binding XRE family transcriptional regulator